MKITLTVRQAKLLRNTIEEATLRLMAEDDTIHEWTVADLKDAISQIRKEE